MAKQITYGEESRQAIFQGPVYLRLAPLLDGSRSLEELARDASPHPFHEMLLALGRSAEAAALFEQVLERHTNRTLALVGLAKALEAEEDAVATDVWERIDAQWQGQSAANRAVSYSWLVAGSL